MLHTATKNPNYWPKGNLYMVKDSLAGSSGIHIGVGISTCL